MSLFGSKKTAVGLEIGTFTVRAVELSPSIPFKLTAFAEQKIDAGAVIDGEISEVADVARALKALWKKGNFSTKNVIVGIANPKVLARQIELPFMDDQALRNAINFQAQDYIPIPPDELILDYHIMGQFDGEEGQKMAEILLVAAHREMVNKFCEAVEKAGLIVDIVYLSSLALARALVTSELETEEQSVVLANISADITNIVVIERGYPRFARIMSYGGNEITNSISSHLGISFSKAEKIKRTLDLTPEEEEEQATKEDDKDENKAQSLEICKKETQKFVDELRRSVEYHFGQDITKLNIKKVILSGGATEMKGFDKFIGKILKLPVEKGRALNNVEISSKITDESSTNMLEHEPALAIAMGLAMRGLES